jgi:phosphoglycerate dehydrogenase-like enzyme
VVVVGLTFPGAWDRRDVAEQEADVRLLREVDPGIEVLDVRYVEPDDVRVDRGAGRVVAQRRFPALTGEQRALFGRVEVVLAQDLPPDVIEVAPNLRWVQCIGSSTSHLDVAAMAAAGVRVTNAAGVAAGPIAEFVLARLLQVWKRLPEIDSLRAEATWEPRYGRELDGAVLLVVGLGAIGTAVARLATGFGIDVVGVSQRGRPNDAVAQVHPPSRLPELLPRADAIVAALPETTATRAVFDATAFAAMRPGAVFGNIGRGSAVVEPDLIASLADGHLGAAFLDVASTEPLPPSSPLWRAPRLLLSAHCSVAPERYWARIHERFRSNLARHLAGEPLEHEVTVGS